VELLTAKNDDPTPIEFIKLLVQHFEQIQSSQSPRLSMASRCLLQP
jgi:hypothetical protein